MQKPELAYVIKLGDVSKRGSTISRNRKVREIKIQPLLTKNGREVYKYVVDHKLICNKWMTYNMSRKLDQKAGCSVTWF